MRSELLQFSHKDLILSKLKKFNLPFSEYTFENMYLWRHESQYVFVEENGVNFLKGVSLHYDKVIVPLDEPLLYQTCLKNHKDYSLFPITEASAKMFNDDEFIKETDRDMDDYIYITQKIADLSGRTLDGKRNQARHFQDDYDFRVEPLKKEYIEGAIKLLKKWSAKHQGKTDVEICLSALNEFELLKLTGICLLIEDEVVGFAMGYPINQEMYDLQFAKADISFNGVYAFLYQSFAKHISGYKWLNTECDLGIEGLRKSRIEFSPDHVEKKWRITAK